MSQPFYLLSNDDGVHAPGINILAEHLRRDAKVMVVAPHLERSGTSSAITVYAPILVEELSSDVYGIEGTPADSMMLGLKALAKQSPDWAISGINRGGNLGTDTIYSGTVGAAMEACIVGVPAMAVSIEGREPLLYETAARVTLDLLKIDGLKEATRGGVLNVNVPNLPYEELTGVVTATLGKRIYHELAEKRLDPRGRPYYWLGPGARGFEPIEGSDLVAIQDGAVTLTILQPDLCDRKRTRQLQEIMPSQVLTRGQI